MILIFTPWMTNDVGHLFLCLWWEIGSGLEQGCGRRDNERGLILDTRGLERAVG